MAYYDLSHLTQNSQKDTPAIQDDEALLLYALIRVVRVQRVLELGFFDGYSATNFLKAVGPSGKVYSCDINTVKKLTHNHTPITKDAATLSATDVDNTPLDLVFFDCHNLEAQMTCFQNLTEAGIITNKTILALHDTGTYPYKVIDAAYEISPGEFVHQPVERLMVNKFAEMGYSPLCLHTEVAKTTVDLPFRKGLTVLSKFEPLKV